MTHQTISANFQNRPLRSALVEVARHFHTTIALTNDVSGFVSVELHHADLDAALTALLNPLGYVFHREHGVIVLQRATPADGSGAAPAVVPLSVIAPDQAIAALRTLYPQASLHADRHSNALVVVATPDDLAQMKTLLQAIDIKSPGQRTVQATILHTVSANDAITRIKPLFPNARFSRVGYDRIIVSATPADQTEIRTLLSTLDEPHATPPPSTTMTDVVHLVHIGVHQAAKSTAMQFPRLRVGINSNSIVLRGAPDDVAQAKALLLQLDVPAPGTRQTVVYRLRTVDAQSVADLLKRSLRDLDCYVNRDVNAISVTTTVAQQSEVADAITRLDSSASSGGAGSAGGSEPSGEDGGMEVVSLRSAIPEQNATGGAAGTNSAGDVTTSIIATLQQIIPSVKVIPLAAAGQIALIGDPYNVRLAKQYVEKLDVMPPLVVLDTKLFEVDETTARNLGLELTTPLISTTFSEFVPVNDGTTRLGGIAPITRTPLSLPAQFNLLIQNGQAHVLADPRITTMSGHTASIRAGDTIGILTTVGGGTGTYATSQIQTFQTGVTLDITPLVTPGNEVTVSLHPVVNSLSGIVNSIPQISTRDTTTTVHLKNDQTLVIGGLIEESAQKSVNKIPLLGSLPLVGPLFQNPQTSTTRNELVIVVTPHIINGDAPSPNAPTSAFAAPIALPTLPPDIALPMTEPGDVRPQAPARQPAINHSAPIDISAGPPPPPPTPVPSMSSPPPPAGVQPQMPVAQPTPFVAPGVTPSATAPALSPAPAVSQPPGVTNTGTVNSFSYGQMPNTNIASPSDPVRIYFATMRPTSFHLGDAVTISTTTTSNVANVVFTIGTSKFALTQAGAGFWNFSGTVPTDAVSSSQTSFSGMLTASRSDGSSASIPVPLQILR